ncbi:uncharacterized protein ATNIH1004_003558 [Aspergillus tanneri]|uniref:Uncharacterized protein n=1 Tax=Aspergillus tanneri TaxID=1220188 RepID=A0A5M9N1N5_9EURO|nr:uncharacterized protein ATNIH1004_003558 [Aspergillus tanneri]KAA8650869.1 hypothetical protein ATNIH1004_003558 [Aspergillus tanneri]
MLQTFSVPLNLPPKLMHYNAEIFPSVDMAETGAENMPESEHVNGGDAGKIIAVLPSMESPPEVSRNAAALIWTSETDNRLSTPSTTADLQTASLSFQRRLGLNYTPQRDIQQLSIGPNGS